MGADRYEGQLLKEFPRLLPQVLGYPELPAERLPSEFKVFTRITQMGLGVQGPKSEVQRSGSYLAPPAVCCLLKGLLMLGPVLAALPRHLP